MSRQMLIRQDQAAAVEAAAIVYEIIVDGGEHVDVEGCEVQIDKASAALVSFVKIDAFSLRDLITSCTFAFLALFIAQVVGNSDLGDVIHVLGAQLDFHVAAGAVVVKGDVGVTGSRRTCFRRHSPGNTDGLRRLRVER